MNITKYTKNTNLVKKMDETLPILNDKQKYFRSNSQVTLSLQSLTMLNGKSPYRVLRQILAEVSKRKKALTHNIRKFNKLKAKYQRKKEKNEDVSYLQVELEDFEASLINALKDINVLIDRYHDVANTHNIDLEKWNELDFEQAEYKHHVRRAFELVYHNLLQSGRVQQTIIEYLQQYGLHPQVVISIVRGYIAKADIAIQKGEIPDENELEDFLDEMAEKFKECPFKANERLFGRKDIINPDNIIEIPRTDNILEMKEGIDTELLTINEGEEK